MKVRRSIGAAILGGAAGLAALAATGARAQQAPASAEFARRPQRDRCRRRARPDAEGLRDLSRREPELVSAHHLREGPGAGTRRQDQGAAGCRARSISTSSSPAATGSPPASSQNLWLKLLPTFADRFPGLEENYEPAALNLHKAQGQGFGVVINYYPSGPLIEYAPERVKARADHGGGAARLGEGAIRNASCMRGPRIPARAAPS